MRALDNKLAWLAGLIDGEGCFTVGVRKQHVSTLKITPVFLISMKNGEWSKEVIDILNKLKIRHYTYQRKNQTEIIVKHWKNILPFIISLKRFSIVKRQLMKEFIKYKPNPKRNRFVSMDSKAAIRTADFVSFVRAFNRGKNRPYKWDGKMILDFFGIKKEVARVRFS